MASAWGPSTWGPSPQEEEQARRAAARARARSERPTNVRAWLGQHPWVWVALLLVAAFVVLGPWLHVVAPTASGLHAFFCPQSASAAGANSSCNVP